MCMPLCVSVGEGAGGLCHVVPWLPHPTRHPQIQIRTCVSKVRVTDPAFEKARFAEGSSPTRLWSERPHPFSLKY